MKNTHKKTQANSPQWSPCLHPGCSSLFSAPHWPGHVKTGAQLLLSSPSLWLVGLAIWLTPHTQLQAKFVRACPDGACSLAEKTALRNLSGLAQEAEVLWALTTGGSACLQAQGRALEGRWRQSGEVQVARGCRRVSGAGTRCEGARRHRCAGLR